MAVGLTILGIVLVLNTLFFIWGLRRNNQVHDFRVFMIHNHFEDYERLPSYDEMYSKYWYKKISIENWQDWLDLEKK